MRRWPRRAERSCRLDAYRAYEQATTLYYRNVRTILDGCFPGIDLAEQMRMVWITDAYLCSAPVEGGSVPAASWRTCAHDYLLPRLALLRDRAIVVLGRKAQARVAAFDGEVLAAGSVAPPA
ncbi:MAG: hypothetical protein AB1551_06670 [Actinomycetota bacterium]